MTLIAPDGQHLDPHKLTELNNPAIFPGSFNPLHHGHKGIYDLISKLGFTVVFELSKRRFDKEPYTEEEIKKRSQQFEWYAYLLLTDAPLFSDKQRCFNFFNPYWIMGYDTALRWLEEYRSVDKTKKANMDKMKLLFLGRLENGVYYDPNQLLDGTEKFQYQCIDYKCDISSTQIRKNYT